MLSQHDTTGRHQPLASFTPPLDQAERPALFEPSAVLPDQFFSVPPCGARRERALMQVVLEDVIACCQKQFVNNLRRVQRLAKEAEIWLFSDEEHWPFSFLNICGALGLEPEYLRHALTRWRQHPPATRPRTQLYTTRGQTSQIAA